MPFRAKDAVRRCPYNIPPLPTPVPAKSNKLDRKNIIRFLLIEALLRSPKVWDLYEKAAKTTMHRKGRTCPPARDARLWVFLNGNNRLSGEDNRPMRRLLCDNSLRKRFHIEDGWAVLLGSHHRYLEQNDVAFRIGEAIVDLSTLHRSKDLQFRLEYLEEKQLRYVYLMIDSVEVSSHDLMLLERLLQERKKAESEKNGFQKLPSAKDLPAWLNYLRCYDMHRLEHLSCGDAGSRVYGSPKGRSEIAMKKKRHLRRQVVRACKEVDDLIAYAETGRWILPSL